MILPLAYYGDAVLRKKTLPITVITDEIRQLAKDMIESMHAYDGVGLAAPQVHRSLSIFVTCAPHYDENGQRSPGVDKVFINPKLSNPSAELVEIGEACLSIPTLYGDVLRPERITVTYMNLDGETITEELSGFPARVAMHENDHINGVLWVDRMHGKEKKRLEGALLVLKKNIDKYKKVPKVHSQHEHAPEM